MKPMRMRRGDVHIHELDLREGNARWNVEGVDGVIDNFGGAEIRDFEIRGTREFRFCR